MKLPLGEIKLRLMIARFWENWRLPVLIGSAIILLLVVVAYFFSEQSGQTQTTGKKKSNDEIHQMAKTVNAELSNFINNIRKNIDIQLAAGLLEQNDPQAQLDFTQSILSTNPDLNGALLLPSGSWNYDKQSKPPITYNTLTLLDDSLEKSRNPYPDAQLPGSDLEHIALVTLIKNTNNEVSGVLLLGLNYDWVQRILDRQTVKKGYLRIRQAISRGPDITIAGKGNVIKGIPNSVKLPATNWQLDLIIKDQTDASEYNSEDNHLLLIALAVFALLIAVFVIYILKKKRQSKAKAAMVKKVASKQTKAPVSENKGNEPAESSGSKNTSPTQVDTLSKDETHLPAETTETDTAINSSIPSGIFRAYDIRGNTRTELTAELTQLIGQAIGSEAFERGQQTLVVGRDGRTSSPELTQALITGIRNSGRDVIDIGLTATPVTYFATHFLETSSGVMVTGSHNPGQDNGFKIMLAGEILSGQAITALYERLLSEDLQNGNGSIQQIEVDAEYIRKLSEDIPLSLSSTCKIVVDCGNGAAGNLAPRLYRALGHDVIELFCDIDGSFPNHHPDPSQPENLQALIHAVKENEADIGFAFDGDGDRLGVVDSKGHIIWPDQLMMIFAQDILKTHPGSTVVFDVKCTDKLRLVIEKLGGKPLMWKTGHSVIRSKMIETGAKLAGDLSGHIFIGDRWYGFDDAMYAGARLLQIIQTLKLKPDEAFAKLPATHTTPELRINIKEGSGPGIIQKLMENLPELNNATLIELDGLRINYADGWGLVRASNTTSSLTLRFEGNGDTVVLRIQNEFKTLLLNIQPDLVIPF